MDTIHYLCYVIISIAEPMQNLDIKPLITLERRY